MENMEGNDNAMRKEVAILKTYISSLRFTASSEAFNIGAPHIEKESFERVRFVMLIN